MPRNPRPWPTPPFSSFRDEAYFCHNCGTESDTLGVGSWLADTNDVYKYERNKLVLCRICFEKFSKAIVDTTGGSFVSYMAWLTKFRDYFKGKKK